MRIVSGQHRGRTIHPPRGFSARPTTDFAKEALFNIIAGRFDMEDICALDLFSGTGSISFELASRGCRSVDSVEVSFAHHAFIQKTAQQLQLARLRCYRMNAFAYLSACRTPYDLIFADPPFDLGGGVEKVHATVFARQLLTPRGWLVLEHPKGKDLSGLDHFKEQRSYGSVNFSIYEQKKIG